MTNILATMITVIVTNVTTIDDSKTGCPYGSGCLVLGCNHYPAIEATWKEEVTTVQEVKKLLFKWEGETREVTEVKPISSSVKRWERKGVWVEKEAAK